MTRARVRSHCRIGADDFKEARAFAAVDLATAAALLRVTVRTVRNWESGRAGVPYSAYELLRILSGYALPGEAWRGWTIKGDTLWSPERRAFYAVDLEYWGLTCAMARQWLQEQAQRQTIPPTDNAFPLALSSHERAAQAGTRGPPLTALRSRVARVGSEREPDQPEAFKQHSVLCLDPAEAERAQAERL